MAVYQVSVVFEAEMDEFASATAEKIAEVVSASQDLGGVANAKIAFTKFEKEAPEVASE